MAKRPEAGIDITARNKMQRAFDDANRNLRGLQGAARLATRAFAGLSVAVGAKEFIQLADRAKTLENRLKLVTKSTAELNAVQERLFGLSQDTRASFEGTVELFARMARATGELGISQGRLIGITRTINQAMIVSGATAQEAEAALIQLSQGLAAGALRGEELNSVMEQTPRLAQAIAAGMGVTIGELRKLGQEGKLTADTVIRALESQADAVNAEFSEMGVTVGQAMTNVGNSFLNLVGRIDEAVGASERLAKLLVLVSDGLDSVTQESNPLTEKIAEQTELIDRLQQGLERLQMRPGTPPEVIADLERRIANERANLFTLEHAYRAVTAAAEEQSEAAKNASDARASLNPIEIGASPREVMRDLPAFDPTGGRSEEQAKERQRYLESLQERVDALRESLMSESQLETSRYQEKLDLLNEYLAQNTEFETEYRTLREQLEAEHQERMTEIAREAEAERLANTKRHALQTTQSIVSGLTEATGMMASSSKRMFELNKKLAKAEAVINAHRAIQQVWADPSLPFYAKVAATAVTAAKTAANISAINATQFGGGTTPSAAGTPTVNGNPVPTSGQIITVRGIDPSQLFSGRQIIDLVNQAQKDGARLVMAA
jgi:tape measure domain-containing protein